MSMEELTCHCGQALKFSSNFQEHSRHCPAATKVHPDHQGENGQVKHLNDQARKGESVNSTNQGFRLSLSQPEDGEAPGIAGGPAKGLRFIKELRSPPERSPVPDFGLFLENKGCESNCFVNSILQLFWHIDWLFSCIDTHHCNTSQRGYDQGAESKEARLSTAISRCFNQAYERGSSRSNSRPSYLRSSMASSRPSSDITQIRIELFKATYANVRIEKFMPFTFGDANEVMETVLNSLHHALSANADKKELEDLCFNPAEELSPTNFGCTVHHACFLNIEEVKRCRCSPNVRKKSLNPNTFSHIIASTQALELLIQQEREFMRQGEGIRSRYESRFEKSRRERQAIQSIEGRLFEVAKEYSNSEALPYCVNGDDGCSLKQTYTEFHLKPPFPQLFNVQVNWEDPSSLSKDKLLRFLVSIPAALCMSQVFDGFETAEESPRYKIKAIVFFTGNHYFVYVKSGASSRSWVLHNDDLPEESKSITEIVKECLENSVVPSLLVYEKSKGKLSDRDYDLGIDLESYSLKAALSETNYPYIDSFKSGIYDYSDNQVKAPSITALMAVRASKAAVLPEQLEEIKDKIKGRSIYLFYCNDIKGCRGLIALHHERCKSCNLKNKYFDASLKVSSQDDKALDQLIQKAHQARNSQQLLIEKTDALNLNAKSSTDKAAELKYQEEVAAAMAFTSKELISTWVGTEDDFTPDAGGKDSDEPTPSMKDEKNEKRKGVEEAKSERRTEAEDVSMEAESSAATELNQPKSNGDQVHRREQPSPKKSDLERAAGDKSEYPPTPALEDKQNESTTPTQAEPEQIPIWTCSKCSFPNRFESEDKATLWCTNMIKKCYGFLDMKDETALNKALGFMTDDQYAQEIGRLLNEKDWEDEMKKEIEWTCQHCGKENTRIAESTRSWCRHCYKDDELLKAASDIQLFDRVLPSYDTAAVLSRGKETSVATFLKMGSSITTTASRSKPSALDRYRQKPIDDAREVNEVVNRDPSDDKDLNDNEIVQKYLDRDVQIGYVQVWTCPECKYPNSYPAYISARCKNSHLFCEMTTASALRKDPKCIEVVRRNDFYIKMAEYDREVNSTPRGNRREQQGFTNRTGVAESSEASRYNESSYVNPYSRAIDQSKLNHRSSGDDRYSKYGLDSRDYSALEAMGRNDRTKPRCNTCGQPLLSLKSQGKTICPNPKCLA